MQADTTLGSSVNAEVAGHASPESAKLASCLGTSRFTEPPHPGRLGADDEKAKLETCLCFSCLTETPCPGKVGGISVKAAADFAAVDVRHEVCGGTGVDAKLDGYAICSITTTSLSSDSCRLPGKGSLTSDPQPQLVPGVLGVVLMGVCSCSIIVSSVLKLLMPDTSPEQSSQDDEVSS